MLAAVVPVKSLSQTKGRLAELLTPGERSRLSLAMLADVLAALRSSGAADLLAVTSPDPEVAAAAGAAGAELRRIDVLVVGEFVRHVPGVRVQQVGLLGR